MNRSKSISQATALNLPKQEIQKYAEELASELNFKPGDPLEALIKHLGGTIQYQTIEEWHRSEHGSIEVEEKGRFTIWLANFTGPLRDRFTLAHELGHYILHSKVGAIPLIRHRQGKDTGPMESEADWFAAGFLMPESIFKNLAEKGATTQELAARFRVSYTTADWRMKEINRDTNV